MIEQKKLPKAFIDHLFSINLTKPIQLVYINSRKDCVVLLPHPEINDERIILWPHAEKFLSANKLIEPSEGSIQYEPNQPHKPQEFFSPIKEFHNYKPSEISSKTPR